MDEVEITQGRGSARRPAYIRQAGSADLLALHEMDVAVFGELAYPLFVLRQFVDVHRRHFLVVDADPPLLGYVLAAFEAPAEDAWLLGLGIRPEARGHGYGRALMDRSLERLRGDGVRRVLLTVKPENIAAIRLYESIGFNNTGFHPHYYGDGEGRLMMAAQLATEVSGRPAHRIIA
jgi:[ribosomal protein S18]-alanine N-acetyltransferase